MKTLMDTVSQHDLSCHLELHVNDLHISKLKNNEPACSTVDTSTQTFERQYVFDGLKVPISGLHLNCILPNQYYGGAILPFS
ncbi:hypothetical protein AMECASPLE_003489 [Ameca splendens]|uniref:Uncharacterized protein n=1 Tax=Ameca splendens TaxID=208324 RepID=A0ABV0Z930_9TELE